MKVNSSILAVIISILFISISADQAADQNSYLQQLNKQQQQILQSLGSIHQNNVNIQQQINTNSDFVDLQKTILENGINNQQKDLLNALGNTYLPTTFKTWECQNITVNQTNAIKSKINDLGGQLENLQELISKQKQCQRTDELQYQANLIEANIEGLKKQLDNTCGTQYAPPDNYVGVAQTNVPCPSNIPFFDGKICLSCNAPAYFDFTDGTCKSCPSGQIFSLAHNRSCIKNIIYQSSASGNNYVGVPEVFPSTPNSSVQACPSDKPFSNKGSQCVACALPQFYNFQTAKCSQCSANETFSIANHSCISNSPKVITISNSNLETHKNFMGKVPSYSSIHPTCDLAHPFFNQEQCVPCDLPSYFNFDQNSCQLCAQKFTFNIDSQQCEFGSPAFVTDLTNSNIYYNGDFNTIREKVQKQKDGDKNVKDCPATTPFYDATKNVCISCQDNTPLFDIAGNSCMACHVGSSFNLNAHICISSYSFEGADVERMMMNTFTA